MWTVLAAAGAGLAGWLLWRHWIRPLLDLRDLIRAIANDEQSLPIVRSSQRPFSQISSDLGRVSDRLRRQRRQIADEGFSLRAILQSMIEGIVIVDSSQRIRLANDALSTMFELTKAPVNRTVLEAFHRPELVEAIERSFREVRTMILEIPWESHPGRPRAEKHFRVHLAPLLPTGGATPAGVLAVFNDVTEVRSLEAVRREFVANVSHEFRTPLAIIIGYVETLLDGALDDRGMAESSLKIIGKHGQRLTLLIDDLLTISRIENHKPVMNFEVVSLEALFRRAVEQMDARVREARAQVRIECEAVEVEVDPVRMEQVLLNLLGNALQYGAAEAPEIRIGARARGEEAEITVTDNGPGIPFKDQPHIFERFYRVHKDRSRDAGGTGLGLSIVKHVVMAHGGFVSVKSTPGMGALFKITLPLRQGEPRSLA